MAGNANPTRASYRRLLLAILVGYVVWELASRNSSQMETGFDRIAELAPAAAATNIREWIGFGEAWLPEQMRPAAMPAALAAVVFVLVWLVSVMRARRLDRAAVGAFGLDMRRSMVRQKHFALLAALVFIGGFVLWGTKLEIASAAVAPGVVSPEGSKRPVQHLEGGIVAEVLVKDGQHVVAGQPLLVMEDVRAKSDVGVLHDQKRILEMRLARLDAERRNLESFAPTRTVEADAQLDRAIDSEIQLFMARRATLLSQKNIFKARILQVEESIASLAIQLEALQAQKANTARLFYISNKLASDGLVAKTRVIEIQNRQAEIEGQIAAANGQVERARKAIVETDGEIASLESKYREDVDAQTSDVRAEVVKIENQITAQADVLARTTLVAQETGLIMGMKVAAPQAVIKPGEIVLEIVPENAKLLVDARVSPLDIDDIRLGQDAQVQLSAYQQRRMPRIEGVVQYISADRFTDERNGLPYFLARIEIEPEQLSVAAPDVRVVAGMPAEVMIHTGDQTFFDYLIAPLFRSMNRAFREK